MVRNNNYDGIMGPGDHFKNGTRQKSNICKQKATLVWTFILFSCCVCAQNEKVSTLFNENKERKVDLYCALDAKFSQMDNKLGLLFGGRLGAVINNSFSVGAAAYGLLPTAKVSFDCPVPYHETDKNDYWSAGYGGLFLEYIHSPNKLLHISTNTLIGCGRVTYKNINSFFSDEKNYYEDRQNYKHPSSFVFIVEPGAALDLNITRVFKMSFGVSYRYAPGFKLKYEEELVPRTFFNGFLVNLSFKFSDFDF